jgi:hypothetical protein
MASSLLLPDVEKSEGLEDRVDERRRDLSSSWPGSSSTIGVKVNPGADPAAVMGWKHPAPGSRPLPIVAHQLTRWLDV